MVEVTVLDYGAGNVRSVKNAIRAAGHTFKDVENADDIRNAEVLVFPGVGHFRKAMEFLNATGYTSVLREYLEQNRPYLGICLGMQTLFEGSEECPKLAGLGVIPGFITEFPTDKVAVPHIGWNGVTVWKKSALFSHVSNAEFFDATKLYFVHSFRASRTEENASWVLTTTNYGDVEFVSAVQKGNVMATQFHPEKSGAVGIAVIKGFLENLTYMIDHDEPLPSAATQPTTVLSKRVIACLDVRTNDAGDLVVTKGDQYDVRESESGGGHVRNMGKPVDLCTRYYQEGADEVAFLNITSFREQPIGDMPMLHVLEASSEKVFVPLTVGGGIREYVDDQKRTYSALDVASRYFRAGADKVSIGSDAVYAAEAYYAAGKKGSGDSAIEQISSVYGKQAVVISLDPRRVYVDSKDDADAIARGHQIVSLTKPGPNGEKFCWYQATVKGGREARDIDAVAVAKACEALGAGEILLNSVDMDGQKDGYDHALVSLVKNAVTIPVIASSGAGEPAHFTQVFQATNCDAALAAGMFHRKEVSIQQVKDQLKADNISVRM